MPIETETRFGRLGDARPEFVNARKTWRETLAPALEELEAERQAVIKRAMQRSLIAGATITLAALILYFFIAGMAIFLALAAVFIAGAVIWMPLMSVQAQTKKIVVGAACEAFGFSYDPVESEHTKVTGLASAGRWLKSNAHLRIGGRTLTGDAPSPTPAFERLKAYSLMPGYDSSDFEDLIEGTRAGAAFSMVECELKKTKGSDENRRTVTVFQGLLFNIEYPERFLGRTLLARDGWWSWGRTDGMDQVDLVSKELEDAFTVYSTDQVEARALLTPDRMERLIALESHFKGGRLRGVFEEGHVTLALEAKDQFEAGSVFTPLVDAERFIDTLEEIGLVCDLIDGFLTRDWYKDKMGY